MKVFSIYSQENFDAYIMHSDEYRRGHLAFEAFYLIDKGHHLVLRLDYKDRIVLKKDASSFQIVEATDEEKDLLTASGYKMMGLD